LPLRVLYSDQNLTKLNLEPEISFIAGSFADLADILFPGDPGPVSSDPHAKLTIIRGN
jgi:hypothetical protein